MSQYLILLAIVPLSCWQLTKIFNVKNKWLLRGLSVGLVVAPFSYGLLQFTYIPIIGNLLGFLGLAINLTHGPVGYFCLTGSGFLETGIPLASSQLVMINMVNAVIFASCYSLIGSAIDKKMEEEKTPAFARIEN